MLHDVQIVMPATSIGGGGSAHAQCQFRMIVVAPAGGDGTAGTPSSEEQFQNQFQTKVCEVVATVSVVYHLNYRQQYCQYHRALQLVRERTRLEVAESRSWKARPKVAASTATTS